MELRLTKLHEPGRDFMVRCCMTVVSTDFVVEGSIVKQCEECDIDVWYDPRQQLPMIPGGTFEAEVVLCLPCTMLHSSVDTDPKWVGPKPPGLT